MKEKKNKLKKRKDKLKKNRKEKSEAYHFGILFKL